MSGRGRKRSRIQPLRLVLSGCFASSFLSDPYPVCLIYSISYAIHEVPRPHPVPFQPNGPIIPPLSPLVQGCGSRINYLGPPLLALNRWTKRSKAYFLLAGRLLFPRRPVERTSHPRG